MRGVTNCGIKSPEKNPTTVYNTNLNYRKFNYQIF